MEQIDKNLLSYILKNRPNAVAKIKGKDDIEGICEFYSIPRGVVVLTDVKNLPQTETGIFAFHVHDVENCDQEPCSTGGHYNPQDKDHPNHAGDMPPLFAFDGEAFSLFYTQRFDLGEIIGKAVVIHSQPDDFTSQPSGNSGEKIAVGEIKLLPRVSAFWLRR